MNLIILTFYWWPYAWVLAFAGWPHVGVLAFVGPMSGSYCSCPSGYLWETKLSCNDAWELCKFRFEWINEILCQITMKYCKKRILERNINKLRPAWLHKCLFEISLQLWNTLCLGVLCHLTTLESIERRKCTSWAFTPSKFDNRYPIFGQKKLYYR